MTGKKVSFTTAVPADLRSRLNATVLGLQRLHGSEWTLSRFVSDALEVAINEAEKEYNDGEPFEATGSLPVGPRIGSKS